PPNPGSQPRASWPAHCRQPWRDRARHPPPPRIAAPGTRPEVFPRSRSFPTPSLERAQIGRQLLDLGVRELDARHVRPRCLCRRILAPADQISPRALGSDPGEIRPDGRAGLAHGVTAMTALVEEDLL